MGKKPWHQKMHLPPLLKPRAMTSKRVLGTLDQNCEIKGIVVYFKVFQGKKQCIEIKSQTTFETDSFLR